MAISVERPSTFELLRAARRMGKYLSAEEASNTAEWLRLRDPVKSYQDFFGDIFPQDFASFLQLRTQHRKNANVLDLMNPNTDVLRRLPLQMGLALSLGDGRTDEQKTTDRALNVDLNVDLLEGNILLKRTWREIKKHMETRGIDSFSLILCRPYGGFGPECIPYIRGLYFKLLDNAWGLLSPDGGVLLTELPQHLHRANIYEHEIRGWLETLKRNNIPARYQEEYALGLTKTDSLHPHLPAL